MKNISIILTSAAVFMFAAACTPTINPVLLDDKEDVVIKDETPNKPETPETPEEPEEPEEPETPASLPMTLTLAMTEAEIFPESNTDLHFVNGKGMDIPFSCSEISSDFKYELELGSGLSGNVTFNEKESAGIIHIDCPERLYDNKIVHFRVSGTYNGIPYEWSENKTVIIKCVNMRLNDKKTRTVHYNSCKICCSVTTDTEFELEFMDGCDQWISVVDDRSDFSKGKIWFQIEAMPGFEEGSGDGNNFSVSVNGSECTNQDRSGCVRIWDKSHRVYLEYNVNQLCYGCSGDVKTGDDQVVEFG